MKPMVGKPALSPFLSDDSITGNHGVLEIHGELCNARCVVALGQSAISQLNAPVAGSGLVLPSLLNINLFYASYRIPSSSFRPERERKWTSATFSQSQLFLFARGINIRSKFALFADAAGG